VFVQKVNQLSQLRGESSIEGVNSANLAQLILRGGQWGESAPDGQRKDNSVHIWISGAKKALKKFPSKFGTTANHQFGRNRERRINVGGGISLIKPPLEES